MHLNIPFQESHIQEYCKLCKSLYDFFSNFFVFHIVRNVISFNPFIRVIRVPVFKAL